MFDTTPTDSTALTTRVDAGRVDAGPTRFPEGFLDNSYSPLVLSETPTSSWLGGGVGHRYQRCGCAG